MKTWEMFKELTEIPGKTFIDDKGVKVTADKHGTVGSWYESRYSGRNSKLAKYEALLRANWKEVKENVSLDKAWEYMQRNTDNHTIFDGAEYRIEGVTGYLECLIKSIGWVHATINLRMYESKEWELL